MRVAFLDEPGEHQLVVTSMEAAEQLLVTLRCYEKWPTYGMCDPDKFRVLGEGVVRRKVLRGAVVSALSKVLEDYGEAGYLERWKKHPFPVSEYQQLIG